MLAAADDMRPPGYDGAGLSLTLAEGGIEAASGGRWLMDARKGGLQPSARPGAISRWHTPIQAVPASCARLRRTNTCKCGDIVRVWWQLPKGSASGRLRGW